MIEVEMEENYNSIIRKRLESLKIQMEEFVIEYPLVLNALPNRIYNHDRDFWDLHVLTTNGSRTEHGLTDSWSANHGFQKIDVHNVLLCGYTLGLLIKQKRFLRPEEVRDLFKFFYYTHFDTTGNNGIERITCVLFKHDRDPEIPTDVIIKNVNKICDIFKIKEEPVLVFKKQV